MTITLELSDNIDLLNIPISEVGVTLRALLHTYTEYDEEIAQTKNIGRIGFLRMEQAKTYEVYQKLVQSIKVVEELGK